MHVSWALRQHDELAKGCATPRLSTTWLGFSDASGLKASAWRRPHQPLVCEEEIGVELSHCVAELRESNSPQMTPAFIPVTLPPSPACPSSGELLWTSPPFKVDAGL